MAAQKEGWVQVSPRETFRWTTPFFDLQFVDIKHKRRKRSSSRNPPKSGDRNRQDRSRSGGKLNDFFKESIELLTKCDFQKAFLKKGRPPRNIFIILTKKGVFS